MTDPTPPTGRQPGHQTVPAAETAPAHPKRAPRHFRVGSTVLGLAVYAALLLALQRLEAPRLGALAPPPDVESAIFLGNLLSRSAVALISAVFASLFLAIPLTASMYTPELIELFVRSWVNRVMLGLFVFSAGLSIWMARLVAGGAVPVRGLNLSAALLLVSIGLLLPYLFYVFRFLSPGTIIDRVATTVVQAMQPGRSGSVRAQQRELARRIHQLGNIILRALERADRDVALAAVDALERCGTAYLEVERRHVPEWFEVEANHFPGLSREAIELINREHTWVEMELLRQLALAYQAALAKVPDVLSAISRAGRRFALAALARDDQASLELCIRYFNNFLREAIKRRDLHAVFDVLYHYRLLAVELWQRRPALVVRIARYLDYYGRLAGHAGLPFAHDLVAYDLGSLVAHASVHERAPWLETLLETSLQIRKPGLPALASSLSPGMFKARLILAAHLIEQGRTDLAGRVEQSLEGAPAALVQHARGDLLGEVEACFWEVTDRQVNLDHLEPACRQHVEALLTRIEPSGA